MKTDKKVSKSYKRKSSSNDPKAKGKSPVNVEKASKDTQNNVESKKSISVDTKYIYPADKVTKKDRKLFRTSARATYRSFLKKIDKATTTKESKALTAEFNKFKKDTFCDGVKATIGR